MTDDKEQKNTEEAKVVEETVEVSKDSAPVVEVSDATPAVPATPATAPQKSFGGSGGGNKREFKKNRRSPRRREGVRSEFDQKILDIRRVTRVSAGGRRFSFAVSIVIGNKKGKVGVGTGKAGDTSLAIEKAAKSAKRNLIEIKMTSDKSISHAIKAKYCAAIVLLMPAPGRGVIAGSALRDVIELGGLTDINAKIISGSKNKLNIAQSALKAFGTLQKQVGLKKKEVKKDDKKVEAKK